MEHYLREVMTAAFSLDQRRALAARQADQDRTVEAIDQLNAALVAAASGRTAVWRRNVADALEVLDQALTVEATARAEPDGLLSDIACTQPRLRNRVRGLRVEYDRLSRQIHRALDIVTSDPEVGVAETRMHVSDLIGSLQLLRGRESDLIYEAYFDAFNHDIEEALGAST
jgi:hypothetical protein